jgi:hypothetical protein
LPQPIKTDSGHYELTLYDDKQPSELDFEQAHSRLNIAFPKMKEQEQFFILLTEFVITHGFTAKRLKDAVNHVIANFQYKELNISDIIKFDKRARLYTYSEYCNLINEHKAKNDDFEVREVNGKNYWVLKKDLLNN